MENGHEPVCIMLQVGGRVSTTMIAQARLCDFFEYLAIT